MSDATRWDWGSQGMTKRPDGLFVTYEDAEGALMTTVMKLLCCSNCGNRSGDDVDEVCGLTGTITPGNFKCDNWIFAIDTEGDPPA